MTLSFLQAFLDWITQHSFWSGLIIFAIACSESLALVGLLVPGAVLMFALGTLITTGHLAFWPTVSWAVLGAIAGDGISYWLGYYYQDRLVKLWPLSHHPQLLTKGIDFFQRHGGKSVLFGRFFGPMRPIVPAIAGMYGMPLTRFFLINIASGIAWAPLYLLPGMVFGLSLTVAGEVAGRLVAAILILLTSVLILLWLGKRLYQALLPRIDKMLFSIARWSRHHPVAGQIPDALIRPDHPEIRVLSLLALILFLTSSLFIAFTQLSGETSLLRQVDKLLHTNLTLLHNPWFDRVMLVISSWAGTASILLITALHIAWLLGQRNLLALWHLLAALLLTSLLSYGLPLIFTTVDANLPSGPIMMMTAVFGFIAVVVAREISLGYHLLVYLLFASLIFLAGFARVYLQQDAFSEALGGMMLGSIWVAILGIAYRRHVQQPYVKTPALILMGAALCVFLFIVTPALPQKGLTRQVAQPVTVPLAAWQEKEWLRQATVRRDIRFQRNHPLNLQWAGELDTIRRQLKMLGWHVPVAAQSLQILQWFNPSTETRALPLLSQVHDGHYDVLRMIRFDGPEPRFIRLWQTDTVIQAGKQIPLWVGTVGRLYRQQLMGLTMLRTATDYVAVTRQLQHELTAAHPPLVIKRHVVEHNTQTIQLLLLNSS